jgi:integrase
MPKITNQGYRKFLDGGLIDLITEDQLKAGLKRIQGIRGQYKVQAEALTIGLYYTGARPAEVLSMKGKDVTKKDTHIVCSLKGMKRGRSREIYLKASNPLIKRLYDYAICVPPEMYLFWAFRGKHVRQHTTKKGEVHQYTELSNKVRYWFGQWFDGIIEGGLTPYVLRHSRFSSLSAKGVTPQDIMLLKGARDMKSVTPYLHLDVKKAKDLAKKID